VKDTAHANPDCCCCLFLFFFFLANKADVDVDVLPYLYSLAVTVVVVHVNAREVRGDEHDRMPVVTVRAVDDGDVTVTTKAFVSWQNSNKQDKSVESRNRFDFIFSVTFTFYDASTLSVP